MIYICGDSHAHIYQHIPNALLVDLGPATAHNLIKLKSKTGALYRIIGHMLVAEVGSAFAIVLGEIDCRIHIYRTAIRENRKFQRCIDETVSRYIKALMFIRAQEFKPIVHGNVPASRQENFFKYPQYGSNEERAEISRRFNDTLGIECRSHGIPYFDVYKLGYTVANDGLISLVAGDSVHLNPERCTIIQDFTKFLNEVMG